jgi:hypothetical protein
MVIRQIINNVIDMQMRTRMVLHLGFRALLEFEIYVTQHLIDYKLAEVVGFEKG